MFMTEARANNLPRSPTENADAYKVLQRIAGALLGYPLPIVTDSRCS